MSRAPRALGSMTLAVATLVAGSACERGPAHPIVPLPAEVTTGSGSFVLDASTTVAVADPSDVELVRLVETWSAPFRDNDVLPLAFADDGAVRVAVDGAGEPESYRLEVDPTGIRVTGSDHAGAFYGLQTLSQLLPPGAETGVAGRSFELSAISVSDAPRFRWRGMHLDVARHFHGPDEVKRYIDLLARYKFNRFHWHLTDDQGWRIEIEAFPRLTEVGAFRSETHVGHGREEYEGDGRPHGGFYTKDEVREIVAYAQERHIVIVPEIEMPGHATAALAAYPQYACTEGPFEVARTWGVFEDVFCPYEETFDFLETVLAEVIELFPGPYVHVGGDEVPTTAWEESEYVRELILRENLTGVDQVQPWFMRRIERFLRGEGKRMVGWEEILGEDFGPGVSTDAVVMAWLGLPNVIRGTRKGHEVVMTPTSHVYFDYYQSQDVDSEPLAIGGLLPLDTVYAFEPVPQQLRERDAERIIGAQGNVWTEYMPTWDHVEYMLLPRMLALSEVVWSPREQRTLDDFRTRLDWHLERFDALGIDYRPPDPR